MMVKLGRLWWLVVGIVAMSLLPTSQALMCYLRKHLSHKTRSMMCSFGTEEVKTSDLSLDNIRATLMRQGKNLITFPTSLPPLTDCLLQHTV